MIAEDYCSFEVAKLLKEKGFNIPCMGRYSVRSKEFHLDCTKMCNNGGLFECAAPSHAMAMKWLREVYGLHISLEPRYDYDSMHVVFLAFVQNVADVHEFFDGRKSVASYPNAEKSYELAIKYCLENLI